MKEMQFITPLHRRTARDYVARVTEADKAACAEIACQWGYDYWDGDRKYGYGGYRYDGRWSVVAQAMIDYYQLPEDARILDVGCGKGFLLHEFQKLLPKAHLVGLDISEYALTHAKEEIKPHLVHGNATALPFEDKSFDLVYSITTLHNLEIFDLKQALQEMMRVTRGPAYMATESYRNEREKVNLLYWQLTCKAFFSVEEWLWLFESFGFSGDYEFIFFE